MPHHCAWNLYYESLKCSISTNISIQSTVAYVYAHVLIVLDSEFYCSCRSSGRMDV